jgi:hypothetical protein
MVLKVENIIRTKEAEKNWSLHQCNFLAGSRKTVPLAFRSEDWIQNSNAKQSLTSAGGKSYSPNILFKK